jgi:hypothetical protein
LPPGGSGRSSTLPRAGSIPRLIAFRSPGDTSIGILSFTNPAFPASYGPCEYEFSVTPG